MDNGKTFVFNFFRRFFTSYFLLYALPFPFPYIPYLSVLSQWYYSLSHKIVVWTGMHLYGVAADILLDSDGSSDSSFNYIRQSLFVLFSLLAALFLTLRKPLPKVVKGASSYIITYIQYYLAFTMLRYGAEKIIKSQFPFPYYTLNETYGESSPFRLFKSFMGFSPAYNYFLGFSEAVAALLLLFRTTKFFGALVSSIILLNIVVLNFTYDLPVKTVSLALLLMSFFLLTAEYKFTLTFHRKNTSIGIEDKAITRNKRNTKWWMGLQAATAVCLCYSIGAHAWRGYKIYGDGSFSNTSLFGIYNTKLFIKNGDTLLPLLTDSAQWKAMNIGTNQSASLKMMNDSMKYCKVTVDSVGKTISIIEKEDSTYKGRFSYSIPDVEHIILRGRLKEDSVYIKMDRQNYNRYRLVNRGFHWVNEHPYAK